VKPLLDCYYISCFYISDDWKRVESKDSEIFKCSAPNFYFCFISFIPYYLRFWQCMHMYYYTRLWFPHTVNAGKYLSTCTLMIILYFKNSLQVSETFYYLFYFYSTTYSLLWDNFVDWGLWRSFQPKSFLLRERMKYPKYVYYLSMILNLLLRYIWIIILILEKVYFKYPIQNK